MKGVNKTLYAKYDGYDFAIYATNPAKAKPTTETVTVWDYAQFKYVDKEVPVVDIDSLYSLSTSDMNALVGRKLGKTGVHQIKLSLAPSAQGRTIHAVRTSRFGMIELYDEKPTLVTGTQTRLKAVVGADGLYEIGDDGLIKHEITTVKYKTVGSASSEDEAPLSITEFCQSGFRRGTGLRIPRNTVTPIKVRVTRVTA